MESAYRLPLSSIHEKLSAVIFHIGLLDLFYPNLYTHIQSLSFCLFKLILPHTRKTSSRIVKKVLIDNRFTHVFGLFVSMNMSLGCLKIEKFHETNLISKHSNGRNIFIWFWKNYMQIKWRLRCQLTQFCIRCVVPYNTLYSAHHTQ